MPKVLPADLGICRIIIRGAQCPPSAVHSVRATRAARGAQCPPSAVRAARGAQCPRCPPSALPAVRRPRRPPSALPAVHSVRRPPSAVRAARGAQCPRCPRCPPSALPALPAVCAAHAVRYLQVYDLRRLPQSMLSRSRRLPNAFTLPSAAKLTARYSGSLNSYSIKSPSEPYPLQSASVMSSVHCTSIL